MKRVICDTCGTQTEPDPYGFAPHGSDWLSISVRKGNNHTIDCCSSACAVAAIERLAPAPVALVCPTCLSPLTDRVVVDGKPAYCDTCDAEQAIAPETIANAGALA
jgi:hypothetical protein